MSPVSRFGQDPSYYSPHGLISQSTMLQKRSVQGYRRTKHKTYRPLDKQWVIPSTSKQFNYFLAPRDKMCFWSSLVCILDHYRRPVSDSFWNIFLKRYRTKFGQKFHLWPEEYPKCFPKLVISKPCVNYFEVIWIFLKIKTKNISSTSSKSNQLRNKKCYEQNDIEWISYNLITDLNELSGEFDKKQQLELIQKRL